MRALHWEGLREDFRGKRLGVSLDEYTDRSERVDSGGIVVHRRRTHRITHHETKPFRSS